MDPEEIEECQFFLLLAVPVLEEHPHIPGVLQCGVCHEEK